MLTLLSVLVVLIHASLCFPFYTHTIIHVIISVIFGTVGACKCLVQSENRFSVVVVLLVLIF